VSLGISAFFGFFNFFEKFLENLKNFEEKNCITYRSIFPKVEKYAFKTNGGFYEKNCRSDMSFINTASLPCRL